MSINQILEAGDEHRTHLNLRDAKLMRQFSYIDGKWVDSANGNSIVVTNPADGSWVGEVSSLGSIQSEEAVNAAQRAFGHWSQKLPGERAELLRRWYELILEHKSDLAQIMVAEQGKPLSEALGEIDYAASFVEFYAEEAKRPNIEGVTSHLNNAEVELWREPVGVCALVTPWNFPSAMLTRKAAAALGAGCTVVAHPSAETPFSALALAELAERAGFESGVFNVVTGVAPDIVAPWTKDPRVRALSFTGSTQVGRLLYRQCADTVKTLVLELGGHAPFIVFDDCDLDQVVKEAIAAKFATTGQDCLGANRFYVHEKLYEQFCEKFAKATAALTIGPGVEDPDLGPLMNQSAFDKQVEHVRDAVAKGARILCGGKPHQLGGLFYEPTILADVSDDAKIMQEETFGPVAAIQTFSDEDLVTQMANATEYGLIAYLHTMDPKRIYRMTRALQFGMVAVNRSKVTGAPIPFGGFKQSGLAREGARQGLEAFTEIKYVCRDWA
ncbi:NAD-dependent succinate-semialdehyde dehydrogenase [Maritalea porphyrae]|uniref:NAD-dependent succinate-semialdehyde dehydrogenase n=1 Tax=Maritalea porphyrae TaxID=880732 RepID=A0ABQ5UR07_9HYPH|nr:NAD-dependent succinate-semialdehyde dehydrogenase [Maritalea porphyrae]GLQ17703.1 NAD-dependent succinate-semialdehyde dehydrogenase [Maritalea porphyrae]